jgi:hypothetical protein
MKTSIILLLTFFNCTSDDLQQDTVDVEFNLINEQGIATNTFKKWNTTNFQAAGS